MDLNIKIIDSTEGFQALEQEWNTLYSQSEEANIFLSWDWMFTWWEVFQNALNTQLFLICIYQKDQLIGIAPFHLLNTFPKSLIQGKTITFLGNGENCKDKIVSQYSDFLVKPSKKIEMVESVSNYLNSNKDKWDFADFEFLLNDSVVSGCFKDIESNIHINQSQYGNRFFIPEVNDFESFLDQMGNRWSKMFAKKNRKLENQGNAEITSSKDVKLVTKAFKQLAQMHGTRWKGKHEFNIFKSKLFTEFHLKILERLVPQDKAFIKTLSLDGKPLSSYYCFKDKSQIHYYQSGFFSENANKYSPLFLLVCQEIKEAIKDKQLFDFMFDEDPSSYKKEQYAAHHEPMFRLMWSHKKSRMVKHNYAKKIQAKYLNIKDSLNKKH